jgi:hypothetical protein
MPACSSNFLRIAGPGVEILRFACEGALWFLPFVTLDRDLAVESEGFAVLPNPSGSSPRRFVEFVWNRFDADFEVN